MTDAAYVLGGWAVTAAVLGGYTTRVVLRSRRLRRLTPPPGAEPGGRIAGEDHEWT